jgi:hypothetical protein
METEVHTQLVDELQRLNARVTELEGGWADAVKGWAKKAMGGGKDVTQASIMEVLSDFDHHVEAHGDTFNFTLKGATCTLTWDKATGAMNLEVGSDKMSIHSLKQLHDQLAVSKKSPGMTAPADLQACTSAVLRQQARSGLGLRRGPT